MTLWDQRFDGQTLLKPCHTGFSFHGTCLGLRAPLRLSSVLLSVSSLARVLGSEPGEIIHLILSGDRLTWGVPDVHVLNY